MPRRLAILTVFYVLIFLLGVYTVTIPLQALPALLSGFVWVILGIYLIRSKKLVPSAGIFATLVMLFAVAASAQGWGDVQWANRASHGGAAMIMGMSIHLLLRDHVTPRWLTPFFSLCILVFIGVCVEGVEGYFNWSMNNQDPRLYLDTVLDLLADTLGAMVGITLAVLSLLVRLKAKNSSAPKKQQSS